MANLDSILKSRDITFPSKVRLVKGMVFPVVMYGCERWTTKKAERLKADAFQLWSWRRLLRVPWTAKRSNQSILKEINPEYSLEGLILKLKLQYFGHLIQRTDSTWCWERLKAGSKGDDRGQDGWMASLNQWTWVWASSKRWWSTGKPGMLYSMGLQRDNSDWVAEQQQRFVTAFLPRSKCLLNSWLQSPSSVILEPKNIKSATVCTFLPIYLPWSDGTRCHDLSFLKIEFKPAS